MPTGWWKGKELRTVRERRGLKQVELAKRVGVTRVTISYLETGKRQPSMRLLLRLAKTLKVTVGELLELDRRRKRKGVRKR